MKPVFIVTDMVGGEVEGYWDEVRTHDDDMKKTINSEKQRVQRQEFKVLSKKEVHASRSKAYTFINMDSLKDISRIEIIGPKGREVVAKGSLEFSLQDEGKTLKIFRNESS